MHKNSFYITLGIWITILPFFGIPGSWKNFLVSLTGIFFILVFLGPAILQKIQTKQQPKETRKEEL
jgi:VIT1/CCC1 family predicted Fe2+/Mn2+ transporter